MENEWLFSITEGRAGHCSNYLGSSYMWMGAHDNNVEGQWDHWESNETLTFQGPWRGGGPNGGTVENCMVLLYGKFAGLWSDMACLDTYSFCMACQFKKFSTMYLKGGILCNTSPFNSKYLLIEDVDGKPSLTGYLHSDISWNNKTRSWVLSSKKVCITMLIYEDSETFNFKIFTEWIK